jgi:hypothetical protein
MVRRMISWGKEKIFEIGGLVVLVLYNIFSGKTASALEIGTQFVWLASLFIIYYWVLAVIDQWKVNSNQPLIEETESPIYSPQNIKIKNVTIRPALRLYKTRLIGIGITGIFLPILLSFAMYRVAYPKKESIPPQVSTGEPTAVVEPRISVRLELDSLPIRVAPHDTAYVLQLNAKINQWLFTERNDGDKPLTWPQDIHLRTNKPLPDQVYVCTITNDEDKPLSSVAIAFHITFHKLVPSPTTFTRIGNKNTLTFTTVPDHISVNIQDKKTMKFSGYIDGEKVATMDHLVELPLIPAGSNEKIYLVSQSTYISKFTVPNEATAVVSGRPGRISVDVIRPQVNITDQFPWFGLGPTTYKWTDAPNDAR